MSQIPVSPVTAQQIVELRRSLVSQHSDSDRSERDMDLECIEAAIGASLQGAYYLSLDGNYLDPLHLAGYLLFYIARRHCFTDGNKRVAWAVLVNSLLGEGLEITASEDEAADFVIGVADGRISQESIFNWLGEKGKLRPYRP